MLNNLLAAAEQSLDQPAACAQGPLVSVIIPVRNDAQRLEVCLRSLSNQDYSAERYEIIVVDNGSSDHSATVAARQGATVLCYPNLRVGALRNRGVQEARGEILAFVDSDHELPAEWIRTGVEELQRDRNVRIVGAPCLAPPQGTWVQRCWEKHRLRNRERRAVPWLGAGNMFLRRADFQAAGGFAENLVAAEDVDLCVRLGQQPGSIVSDLRIANIHHGEPRNLFEFFWKEYWRGSSGLRAFFSHGMPLHELPSLAFPVFHLLAILGLVGAAVATILGLQPAWLLAAIAIAISPALLLATKTCWQLRQPTALPALAALYLTYGLSRAAALFKR